MLHIIKIGGNILDDPAALDSFLIDFAAIEGPKILVHGGGKAATRLGNSLGIKSRLVDGRRITSAEMLEVVTMVYAGLINKNLVASLQAKGCNAIGLTGADANIIPAVKRPAGEIDYGFAGDITESLINSKALTFMVEQKLVPVFCGITHTGDGQLLNTNADTIARCIAVAMSKQYETILYYCFEKRGVLRDVEDESSVIPIISKEEFQYYKIKGIVSEGMIPKLSNAFDAIEKGVKAVVLGHAAEIEPMIKGSEDAGTRLYN